MFSRLLKYFDPNHNYFARLVLITFVGGLTGMVFATIYLIPFKFNFNGPSFWGGMLGGAVGLALFFTLVGLAQQSGPQFPLSTIMGFMFGGFIGPILGVALQFGTSLPDETIAQMTINDILILIVMTGILGLGGGVVVSLSIALTRTPTYSEFIENRDFGE